MMYDVRCKREDVRGKKEEVTDLNPQPLTLKSPKINKI